MSDRELLERAAKAAGLRVEWVPEHECAWIALGQGLQCRPWLPLTDDGDCARLEVAAEIDVLWDRHSVLCRRLRRRGHVQAFEVFADHGDDKGAARRRASVRVAAALPIPSQGSQP